MLWEEIQYNKVVYKLDSDFNITAFQNIPKVPPCALTEPFVCSDTDSVYCAHEKKMWERHNSDYGIPKETIFVGDDGTIFFQSYCDDTIPITTINIYDPDLNYQNTITFDEKIYIMRSYDNVIIAMSKKYPEADLVDEKSELQIIKTFDRSFNLLSSYESIDMFTNFSQFINSPRRPATKVYPLHENYSMSVIGYYTYSINGNTISSGILFFHNKEGELLGRLIVPDDFFFSIQSSDRIFGMSYSNGPYFYTISPIPFLSN
jgi:hypothetical protein